MEREVTPSKQRDLERVMQIVFEEFPDAIALATNGSKRKARIFKVILYGSYGRGGWIDEPHTVKDYQSDFDLLIVVNDKRVIDRVTFWLRVAQAIDMSGQRVSSPPWRSVQAPAYLTASAALGGALAFFMRNY